MKVTGKSICIDLLIYIGTYNSIRLDIRSFGMRARSKDVIACLVFSLNESHASMRTCGLDFHSCNFLPPHPHVLCAYTTPFSPACDKDEERRAILDCYTIKTEPFNIYIHYVYTVFLLVLERQTFAQFFQKPKQSNKAQLDIDD